MAGRLKVSANEVENSEGENRGDRGDDGTTRRNTGNILRHRSGCHSILSSTHPLAALRRPSLFQFPDRAAAKASGAEASPAP
jgi:hypothetical protein